MAPQTEQERKAAARKAAATRKRNAAKRSQSAQKAAATRAEAEVSTLSALQAHAERAVLIPVGAALHARDALAGVVSPYTEGRDSATKELGKLQGRLGTSLKQYERRGAQARTQVFRELKRTRTRVERELRERRAHAADAVAQNRKGLEHQVKATRREVRGQAENLVNRVAALA